MPARKFDYPNQGKKAKKSFKDRTLKNNPDVLYEDVRRNDSTCDLIFLTNFKEVWKTVILEQYPETTETPMPDKTILRLSNDRGTISIFPSGKFLIQGTTDNMQTFEESFDDLLLETTTRRTAQLNLQGDDDETDRQPDEAGVNRT